MTDSQRTPWKQVHRKLCTNTDLIKLQLLHACHNIPTPVAYSQSHLHFAASCVLGRLGSHCYEALKQIEMTHTSYPDILKLQMHLSFQVAYEAFKTSVCFSLGHLKAKVFVPVLNGHTRRQSEKPADILLIASHCFRNFSPRTLSLQSSVR